MPHPADGALIGVQVPDIPGLSDMPDHLLGLGKRVVDRLVAGRAEGIDRFYVLWSICHDHRTLQLDDLTSGQMIPLQLHDFSGGHRFVGPDGHKVDSFLERREIDPVQIPFQIVTVHQLAVDSTDL